MKYLTCFFTLWFMVALSLTPGVAQQKGARPSPGASDTIVELNPAAWKEFKSAEGGFAVLLPGTPLEETRSADVEGQRYLIHVYALETHLQYLMSYADQMRREEAQLTKDEIDAMARTAAEKFGVKLQKLTEISVGGHAGRSYVGASPEGWVCRGKVCVVGKRFYHVAVITPGPEGSSAELIRFCEMTATKFLDSFKLTPPHAGDAR